nr:unnamed protein product [Digitaria exilis]
MGTEFSPAPASSPREATRAAAASPPPPPPLPDTPSPRRCWSHGPGSPGPARKAAAGLFPLAGHEHGHVGELGELGQAFHGGSGSSGCWIQGPCDRIRFPRVQIYAGRGWAAWTAPTRRLPPGSASAAVSA